MMPLGRFYFVLVMASLAGVSVAEAQASRTPDGQKALYVYEMSHPDLDAWRSLFRDEFLRVGYRVDEKSAAELGSVDASGYDVVLVHGAVMAFTWKEPLREWLEKNPTFSGLRVGLFVTANRWFLREYRDQLTRLLGTSLSGVDAVSAATEKMSEDDKKQLIRDAVQRLPRSTPAPRP